MVDSNKLVRLVVKGTYPRIRDLIIAKHLSVDVEEALIRMCAEFGLKVPYEPPFDEQSMAIIESHVWSVPLSCVVKQLFRAAAERAIDGVFVVNEANMTVVVGYATANLEDLARKTGLKPSDLLFILGQVAESLVAVVREHKVIDFQINQQLFQLRV